jgi:hypothetical protein
MKAAIDDLISKVSSDVIALQEHWLTMINFLNDHIVCRFPSMTHCLASGPLIVELFGGTAAIFIGNIFAS